MKELLAQFHSPCGKGAIEAGGQIGQSISL
jgi:hypothetical protein